MNKKMNYNKVYMYLMVINKYNTVQRHCKQT